VSPDRGYWLSAGFSIPFPKPDVRLSPHPAFPRLVSLSTGSDLGCWQAFQETFLPVSIPLPELRFSNRLPPFALWPAFPTADYYDGSDSR
jgi:hypothetical protein